MKKIFTVAWMLVFILGGLAIEAQKIELVSGSYTTVFPGVDAANRNDFPRARPRISGAALGKPIPTNEWWSDFLVKDHGGNAFNYPLSFRSDAGGLVINYTWPNVSGPHSDFREPMSDVKGVTIGLEGLSAQGSTVSDYSDWTVSLNWLYEGRDFTATIGMGMPFVYFTKAGSHNASVNVGFNPQNVRIDGNKLLIENNVGGARYIVFAPMGSIWTVLDGNFTSTLNNKNYWSIALVPDGMEIDLAKVVLEPYAYVFPADTKVSWDYNVESAKMTATYTVSPEVKEGSHNIVFQGMLPHQWANLAPGSSTPGPILYKTVRGQLKIVQENEFSVQRYFHGILPSLPNLGLNSNGYDPSHLYSQIDLMKSEGLNTWTDSYNDGQVINRLVQAAHIARQIGHDEAHAALMQTVRERVEDWLSYENGEVAFLFYYNQQWSALLGYPAGHGQDSNLNDHHFHWGYFIHAAAALEQYYPGWAEQWGPMVNMLVRDAASSDREDTMFPFLRSFSPFAGHCWANGFASFPMGNDQESTSESMQFNSALIHWGSVTGNTALRDLGIFLYTTEQSAIEEYWFDIHQRNFQPDYKYEMTARVWGAGYDNGTFWTTDLAAAYGIEMYPIHGGSLYLGHNPQYVARVWEGMKTNTGVLAKVKNDNLWYDVYWSYLSFFDSEKALELYNDYPDRALKFGISDVHTYHWLHNMNALGQVSTQVTADYPIAAAFDKGSLRSYVAYNYGAAPIVVKYSDGYSLQVPARSMASSRDADFSLELISDKTRIDLNETLSLSATVSGAAVDKVEFYANSGLLGTLSSAPYHFSVSTLPAGLAQIYAVAEKDGVRTNSAVISVRVGTPQPYGGEPVELPGIIRAGHFDSFAGSKGQGITYFDTTPYNIAVNEAVAEFRPDEYVDATSDPIEGATVGWIEPGEWLTYTVNVAQAGTYRLELRYASGVAKGGPFSILADDVVVAENIEVSGTGDWGSWATHTVESIQLTAGSQIIKVDISNGGFNLGKMTFALSGEPNPIDPGDGSVDPGDGGTNPGVCTGLDSSGDFSWIVKEEGGKTYLTFVPELEGVGSTIVLMYYSTNPSSPFPGYIIMPNEPVELSLSGNASVYFYFTYSHPAGGERNTADRKVSFVPGSCVDVVVGDSSPVLSKDLALEVWPNPFSDVLYLSLSDADAFDRLVLCDLSGRVYEQMSLDGSTATVSTAKLPRGLYLLKLSGRKGSLVKKVMCSGNISY